MTAAEWLPVAEVLEQAWKGEFDGERENVYRRFLGSYRLVDVEAALQRLVRTGGPFLPSVSEIIGAIEEPTRPPSWTEAWSMIRGAGARWDQSLVEALRPRSEVVAAFVAFEGPERLGQMPLDDPQYGTVEQKRLEQRYADFCESARERARDGRALVAAGRTAPALPRSPDFAAALLPAAQPTNEEHSHA